MAPWQGDDGAVDTQELTDIHGRIAMREASATPPRRSERITLENVDTAFTYQAWNDDQVQRGREVTAALIVAAKTILRCVPECPTRTRAINNLIAARMIANAAITHEGRF